MDYLVILLGNGLIFAIMTFYLNSQLLEARKAEVITDIRAQQTETLIEVLEILEGYESYGPIQAGTYDEKKVDHILIRLNQKADDFRALENQLAKLEDREPRELPVAWIGPPNSVGWR
jgi:hypothetical protein